MTDHKLIMDLRAIGIPSAIEAAARIEELTTWQPMESFPVTGSYLVDFSDTENDGDLPGQGFYAICTMRIRHINCGISDTPEICIEWDGEPIAALDPNIHAKGWRPIA